MQTFLPFNDFSKSACCLDKRRCWKQVVEAQQILNIIKGTNPGSKWRFHPVFRMWENYPDALQYYLNTFLDYCIQIHKINVKEIQHKPLPMYIEYPPWLGLESLHYSHRCNLLRKALDDLAKGKNELIIRLEANGVLIKNHNLTTKYYWPL